MSKHGAIKRYTLTIEKINSGQYPSFQQIKDFLFEYGFAVSNRTLQRDIEQIRFEFGVEIKYDRYKNGYFIDKEESLNLDDFFTFLEMANTSEILSESLKENKDSLKYIDFDTNPQLKGIEYLQPILQAIKEHRKISFTHQNFHTDNLRKYTLKPYLLKAYRNRWYVVGILGNTTDFRIFGIDRLAELIVQTDFFEVNKELDAKVVFDQTIGLSYSVNPVEEIVLNFTVEQGKYVKTLPLHHSQKILADNANGLRISIMVAPNYELIQEILKYGNTVKVEKPQWLVDEIISNLKDTLRKYGKNKNLKK